MYNQKISFTYFLSITLGVILTWLLHEFSHWAMSESLGYDTAMTLNSTYPIHAVWAEKHQIIISALGPIITLVQALVVFLLLKKNHWNKYLYPLLFTPFYMRLLACFMNWINPNDEGRISASLGLGLFTLPIIISTLLFYLVFTTSRNHHLKWQFQVFTIFIVMNISSVLILSDQYLRVNIL